MAQFKAWVGQRFPRATLVTEELDMKAWNRIAAILDGLATDWPGVAVELGWITTKHPLWEMKVQGAIAAADSVFGEKIAFNPFYFDQPRRITQALSLGEKGGLHPAGARRARESHIISHEWGHLVHAWLRRYDRERWSTLIALCAVDPADRRSPFDRDKAAAICQYARRGIPDAFAEAFSVIQWQKQDLWPELMKRFDQILRGEP